MTDLEQYIDYLHDLACHTEDKLAAIPFCEWDTDAVKEMQALSQVLIVQLSMADDFHRDYYSLPSRETPLVPLQRPHAIPASATPTQGAKSPCKAPAGLGTPAPSSRARSKPAQAAPACHEKQGTSDRYTSNQGEG
jgi:hypothetical protein